MHDFDFTAKQERSYWSSRSSHHSLSIKLSQLDLAMSEEGEPRIDERRRPDLDLALDGEELVEEDDELELSDDADSHPPPLAIATRFQ